MVREKTEDDKVDLEKSVREDAKWQGDIVAPDLTENDRPIEIRGDMEPEKKT